MDRDLKPQLFLIAPRLMKADRTRQNLTLSAAMSRFPAILLILILSLASSVQAKPGDKENKANPSRPSTTPSGGKTLHGSSHAGTTREIL